VVGVPGGSARARGSSARTTGSAGTTGVPRTTGSARTTGAPRTVGGTSKAKAAPTAPGAPDGLERLWTPYRMAYIDGSERPAGGYDSPEACPFCRAPKLSDEDGLVVARGERVYAVLNKFPYNPGHLLICPYRHVADYTDIDDEETAELARFAQTAMRVVRQVSGAAGFNLGMNQGGVAGAGIAAHLHQHIVPRWGGDSNFMPIIGLTKTLPQLLGDTRRLLAEGWAASQPVRRRAARRSAAAAEPPQPTTTARPRRSTVEKSTTGRTAPSTVDTPAPARTSRRRSA
jgi:ATP adenylyltransferase